MRVLVAAIGTRGDVEPFMLVAKALAERGHHVSLGLDTGYFDHLGELRGVERVAIGMHSMADLAAIVRHAFSAPSPAIRTEWAFTAFFVNRREALAARIAQLDAAGFDLLVLPACLMFPHRVGDEWRLRWRTATAVAVVTPPLEREYLEMASVPCLRLAGLAPMFAPVSGRIERAWTFTGFWVDRTARPLAPRLEAFLDAGQPPLLLGMGSATGFDPARLAQMFVNAARLVGARAIVERGWAGLDVEASEDVVVIEATEFSSLFPRCAAVFVHGGTGRVAEALYAGVPLGVLPIVNDQVRWARDLTTLGVCVGTVDPFRPDALTFAELTRRAVEEREPQRIAREIGERLRGEAGVPATCNALEQFISAS